MRPLVRLRRAWAVLAGACALALTPAPASASLATTAALAPTPPMGWDSWYQHGCGIGQSLFQRTAHAMLADGMAAAGYRYVEIDDCWMAHQRDAAGHLIADPHRFPDGIRALADQLHAGGLKLGIYLDTGTATCTGFPGSLGHETDDAQAIAGWTVDALKLDFCRTRPADAEPIYSAWQQALDATGRRILLQICEWGYQSPWTWAPGVGSTWRTTGDYFAYGAPRSYWGAILQVLDLNAGLAAFSRPGAYNDPNALLVGTGVLTVPEERAQMSLWSVLAAPLIAGGDLTKLSRATLQTLINPRVIAVDQDPAAQQGTRIVDTPTQQVWLRHLSDGTAILLFLNPTRRGRVQTFDMASLGLPSGRRYFLRDLWTQSLLKVPSNFQVWVGAHDVRMLRLRPPAPVVPSPALTTTAVPVPAPPTPAPAPTSGGTTPDGGAPIGTAASAAGSASGGAPVGR